jgi:anaphase-promoting complex subunit 1
MKWLPEQGEDIADCEWSSLVIELFALYLALGHSDSSTIKYDSQRPSRRRARVSDVPTMLNWDAMQTFDTPNASACPTWMASHAWRWLGDEGHIATGEKDGDSQKESFVSAHVRYAKQYLASEQGQVALGPAGYLPTALNRSPESRRRAAWSIASALHLLLEEQKLNVMSPEYLSPGRADLRVVLCQIGRWLRWRDFTALHELGIQSDVDTRQESGKWVLLKGR